MTFLVVNVGQKGFFSEFLKENNVEALLEVLQKKGVGGFFSVLWVTAWMVWIRLFGDDFAGA